MFQRILVPLDGSSCAEQALPMAARIARATGATLILTRIAHLQVEYSPYPAMLYTEEALQVNETIAKEYLEKLRTSPVLNAIPVHTEATMALSTADALVERSTMEKVDLIVMCSHGNTGLKRVVLGSIARQLARHCSMPILVLHEHQTTQPTDEQIQHPFPLLVALDGSSLAESAIVPAATLSYVLSAPQSGLLHLMQVLQPFSAETVTSEKTAERENTKAIEAAQAYHKAIEEKLHLGDLTAVPLQVRSSVCFDEDIAEALLMAVEKREQCQIPFGALALATHGRSGIHRWLFGSITEHILGRTKLPLLILRQNAAEGDANTDATQKEHRSQTSGNQKKEHESYIVY